MHRTPTIGIVIPARDEAAAIGGVVRGLVAVLAARRDVRLVGVVVCDNGSSDGTAAAARAAGAVVVHEPIPGYGAACLTALAVLPPVDIVLFTDGDGQFDPRGALDLIGGVRGGADLVIGARHKALAARGALSPQQRFGNVLATWMIGMFWGYRFTDLGPFRAVRADALRRLDMRDRAFGWTVEMQVKAVQVGLVCAEVPVATRPRVAGRSQISGAVRGVVLAGVGIIGTIVRLRWREAAVRARFDDLCIG